MKKTVGIALVFLAIVSLCGCGSESVEFIRGTVSNNVYESKTAELRFAPGPGWVFMSEEEIDMENDEGGEILGAGDIAVLDMSAHDSKGQVFVDVMFFPTDSYVGSGSMTIEEYNDKLVESDPGNTVIGDDVTICGNVYKSVCATKMLGDVEYRLCYYTRKIDGYFISVSLLAQTDVITEEDFLGLFE